MSDPAMPLVPLSLLPPGIRDARQEALVKITGRALGELDVASLVMTDPMTVDAKLLPYLIREFSAQDLIQPDLPEHVQRRILKNIWSLKSLAGYDAGVKLGLKLLGMSAHIEHWHQQDPMGPHNTHNITFFIGEQLFPNEQTLFGEGEKRAALKMIDVMKRQSQGGTVFIGASLRPRPVRIGQNIRGISLCRARMHMAQRPPRLPMLMRSGQTSRSISITRLRLA